MPNPHLVTPEVQQYLNDHLDADPIKLLLKKQVFANVSQKELVAQLECKQKAKDKLPTWFASDAMYYPQKLNLAQASSECSAAYKASLVKGETLADLTGGFGVDTYYFSQQIKQVVYCEKDLKLAAIAKHNFYALGRNNIDCHALNGLDFLSETDQHFDCLYLDPSRRHTAKGKVFKLEDYDPNIVAELPFLFKKARQVLLKTSPLLDISMGGALLKNVAAIHCVAVKNELKELLWLLDPEFFGEPSVTAVDLKRQGVAMFRFKKSEEMQVRVDHAMPQTYLYEPNAAMLKAGAFKLMAQRFNLKKLAVHTHLYTGNKKIDFPGRVFRIQQILPFNKKNSKALQLKKANVAVRNFGKSVSEIRNQFQIRDGGEHYLFFTTLADRNKYVLVCGRG